MSDFKYNGQKRDVDLVASIVKLLDANGIPNVVWGPYALNRYGANLLVQEFGFVIPDQHIDRAREVLLAANFAPCQDDCLLAEPYCPLPCPYAHFILGEMHRPWDDAPRWHSFRVELHKKSRLLWTLPDIPLGAPAPDDPNYMLVTDDRLDNDLPLLAPSREPYTHYPVKIPTILRYTESLVYGYLREKNPEGGSDNWLARFFWGEMISIGRCGKLKLDNLEARIRRFWLLRHQGRQPLLHYSSSLAAELRSENFFPQEEEEEEEEQAST